MNTTDRNMPAVNGELVNRVAKLRLDGQLATNTRSGTAWLPWILCILLALAWAGVGIRGYKNLPSSNATALPPAAERPNTVASTGAPAASGTIVLEVKGYLVPASTIAVSPIDVAGRVVKLNVIEGKKYEVGAVLAELENTSFLAMANEAKAQLESSRRRLDGSRARLAMIMPASVRKIEKDQVEEEMKEAQAQKARAQDEVTRLARLGSGTAAERELNQARFDLQASGAKELRLQAAMAILLAGPRDEQKSAAEADIATAESEVNAAKARVDQAQWRLDNCIIKAPITGTVLTKKAELYNLANPNAFSVGVAGGASGSICEMADLRDLEVEVEIAERDITKLANVKRCRIRADAYPNKTYEATLDRIMPIAVRAKSIVNVRVKVILPPNEEPGTFLKPEMSAVVTFIAN